MSQSDKDLCCLDRTPGPRVAGRVPSRLQGASSLAATAIVKPGRAHSGARWVPCRPAPRGHMVTPNVMWKEAGSRAVRVQHKACVQRGRGAPGTQPLRGAPAEDNLPGVARGPLYLDQEKLMIFLLKPLSWCNERRGHTVGARAPHCSQLMAIKAAGWRGPREWQGGVPEPRA